MREVKLAGLDSPFTELEELEELLERSDHDRQVALSLGHGFSPVNRQELAATTTLTVSQLCHWHWPTNEGRAGAAFADLIRRGRLKVNPLVFMGSHAIIINGGKRGMGGDR